MHGKLLFVYGTLKSQGPANSLIHGACRGKYVLKGYKKYSTKYYPYILPEEGSEVEGELWELTEESLKAVDRYEGNGHLFQRTEIEPGIEAYLLIKPPVSCS